MQYSKTLLVDMNLIDQVGAVPALYLAYLEHKRQYFECTDWFYVDIDEAAKWLAIKKPKLKKVEKFLIEFGALKITRKKTLGQACPRYFISEGFIK